MSRLLAFSNFRRAAYSLLQTPKASSSQLYNCGAPCAYGIPYSLSRLYSQYKVSNRRIICRMSYDVKATLQKTGGHRNLYFLASNKISSHAQIAWKRLSHICSYGAPILPPISRIACAVSLALTRSHLVAPGVLALIFRELTCSERIWAEAEGFPSKDSFYMHAQDGHIYLTSFVFSLFEGLIMFFRAIYLTVIFSPCIAMAPFADSFGIEFRKKWLRLVHLTLEKAGPAFIKWGQWAATRPDLFPSDMCTELAELQTNAPAHGYDYTKQTIERAFGRKIPEIFDKFEEKPIASGSIAQVHRATLKFRYPGQRSRPILVAVKVRHPGVGEAIRRDFMLINFFVKFSKVIPTLKWLRLDESMQQFAVFMMSQVDLAREAANLSRFTYNFRRWKDVSFPKPLYPLVHPAVLVETYEHGNNILHYVDEVDGQEPIKNGLAHIGTHVLLKMLLVDNFIHADMHPGNILVRVNQKKPFFQKKGYERLNQAGTARANEAASYESPRGTIKGDYAYRHQHQTVLQQHVAFFDQDSDGVIWPLDTFRGFRSLEYSIAFSLLSMFLIHFNFSYPTVSGFLPDPFFRIYVARIHRDKHGSDSGSFDPEGRFEPQQFEDIFAKYASGDKQGITLIEVFRFINGRRVVMDIFGLIAVIFEWAATYILLWPEDGRMKKEDIRGVYDGSLFYEISARRHKTK